MTSLTHNDSGHKVNAEYDGISINRMRQVYLILTLFMISIASIFAATVNGVEIFSPPYPTVVIQEAEGGGWLLVLADVAGHEVMLNTHRDFALHDLTTTMTKTVAIDTCIDQRPLAIHMEAEWFYMMSGCDSELPHYQAHVYNRETEELLPLRPDPNQPDETDDLPPDLKKDKVVWIQEGDYSQGERDTVYMMDLLTREISEIPSQYPNHFKLFSYTNGEWVIWEEVLSGDYTLVAYNLETQEHRVIAQDPTTMRGRIADNAVIWGRAATYDLYVTYLDTQETILMSAGQGRGQLLSDADGRYATWMSQPLGAVKQAKQVVDWQQEGAWQSSSPNRQVWLFDLETRENKLIYENLMPELQSIGSARISDDVLTWQEIIPIDEFDRLVRIYVAFLYEERTFLPIVFE